VSTTDVSINKTFKLIQVTDCHLGAEPGQTLLGLDVDESFADVLQCLKKGSVPDLVVATGDISGHGDEESYRRFLQYMQNHYNHPLAWLPGNHDLPAVMADVGADHGSIQYGVAELGDWQCILLDSSVPGHEWGNLSDDQLVHLRSCLESSNKHTLVFVHHQPVAVGSKWIDQYVIRNAEVMLKLLSEFPQVKGLIWGHVHQEFDSEYEHFKLLATPSTCVQFKPNSENFAIDNTMPGYRWFQLHPDGRFDSGVERVKDKHYGVDFASGGY